MEDLKNDGQKLMIIAGTIMYILGSIGNILNIYIFSIWSRSKTTLNEHHNINQTNNSPFYLLASSIANLIVILYPLLMRILFDGYNYFLSPNNTFILCQLRFFTLNTFDLISLTYFCMATFDRYLITSRNIHLRYMSTTKQRTKQIILGIFILFSLHNIPIAIYYQVSNTGQCEISSKRYLYYYVYVILVLLHGLIPIIFLSTFGSLTYKHLKKLQNQTHIHRHFNHDRQISRMLFLMSFAIIISSIPYCTEQIYYVMFAGNNSQQSSLIFLLHVISTLLFYTNPVSNFYIYFISTPNFRRQIKKLIYCKRYIHNQIHTITTIQNHVH